MKKAVIEQFLLGFILVFATITFVATVGDEIAAKNKVKNIQEIALQTAKTMSVGYNQTINMCWAKTQAENILLESKLGRELLQLNRSNPGSFTYEFYDKLPLNADGSIGDNQPDEVRVSVSNYEHENFWYKFLDKNSFSIPTLNKEFAVDAPFSLSINFGGGITAGNGMIGLYQLDENDCVSNARVLMEAQNNYSKGDFLIKDLQSPPNFFLLIPGGGNNFVNAKKGDVITISPQHCENNDNTHGNIHSVTIGAKTRSSQKVHFQHNSLNADNDTFVQAIPTNVWDIYNNYVEPAEGKRSTLEKFLAFCETDDFQKLIKPINEDSDPTNDIIDCKKDLNGQYKYGFEDWDKGDDDYNDVFIDGTQFFIPNSQDNYSVEPNTRRIVFDDDYCETKPLNTPPNLTIEGCPFTIDEDSSLNIVWNASDSDGTIVSSSVMAQNNSASVSISGNSSNTNGTISYQPEENFFGNDTIIALVTDNDGAVARRDCQITVNEVNDPPTIKGAPLTSIRPNQNYSFKPIAEDPDGDVLSFTIQNKPSWLNFNTATGELSGTAAGSDVGTYSNIIISVSDGRGGSAQLPAFNIEVTNQAPVVGSPIPDQTVKEGKSFTYNVSPHFNDPDGEPLRYTLLATIDGNPINWLSISSDGQITSIKIPAGYVGKKIVVTVTASDGKASISDTFNITILNSVDLPSFLHTFDSNLQGWQARNANIRWEKYQNDGKLRISLGRRYSVASTQFSFNFGPAFANKNVSVEFDIYFSPYWYNRSDFYSVYTNGTALQAWVGYTNNKNSIFGPKTLKYDNAYTDGNGRINLSIGIYTYYTSKYAYIDNVKVQLK